VNIQRTSSCSSPATRLSGQVRTNLGILNAGPPAYTPEPGFFGTLQVPASNCGANEIAKTGNIYICTVGFDIFQPATLNYTDPYGRVYNISGITGSYGLNVPYTRDAQGRTFPRPLTRTPVTQKIYAYGHGYDQCGNPLPGTTYDSSGRLQTVTDALGETASYAYNVAGNTTIRPDDMITDN